MRRNIIVVFLLIFGFVGAVPEEPSCEGVGEEEIVLYPNPANCTTFFECVYEELVELACPAGLHWNDQAKQCDYPAIAQCVEVNSTRVYSSCEGVPDNVNVLLPNPADCGSYIQCVHGQPVVRPCPPGLHWSIEANRCEWPEIANCRRNSCEGVPETEDALLPNPEDCGSYIQCVHQQPVVRPCAPGLHWSVQQNRCEWPNIAGCSIPSFVSRSSRTNNNCSGVPANVNVLLPNPADCGSYIQCVHGQPVVRPCPPGLHWSIEANRCEWPEIANCRRNSCEDVPESEDVLLPNPEDCGSYIQCVHQQPVVRPCAPGLHWSVQQNRCDWPNIAGCSIPSLVSRSSRANNNCSGVPANVNVLLPNPADCGSYIQCVHGQPVVRPCPPGLHWSVEANRCEWPEIANCRRNSCEGVPETEDVLLPNPDDCGSYIQCVHQQPVVRPCPPGLHWSAQENRCEWPNTANCQIMNP